MTAAYAVRNLGFSYGQARILKEIDVEIGAGDFFVVIGPNGSGKTTLLKLLAGLNRRFTGEIDVFGRPLKTHGARPLARIVALVPQMVEMDFPFSVMEVVLMGRAPHLGVMGLEKVSDIEKAEQAIRFTGVEHLADRNMAQLSGGERQRVLIARALCQDPRVILLDEPTAALDLAHQVRVMDLMEKLRQEQGVTVVMVSHDLNLAAMYGDHLMLLKKGRIVGLGAPETVLTFDMLEKTYDCKLLVDKNPLGPFPRINQVPGRYIEKVIP